MNSEDLPPLTPREELEAQITALLLGELSEAEAAALREKIAGDAELVKLHARLGLTMGLVKEALASPEPAEMAAPEGLKLSEERREQLLASFKIIKAPEPSRSAAGFRTWGALAAMIAFLAAVMNWMLGSVFVRARGSAQQDRVYAVTADAEEFAERASNFRGGLFDSRKGTTDLQGRMERLEAPRALTASVAGKGKGDGRPGLQGGTASLATVAEVERSIGEVKQNPSTRSVVVITDEDTKALMDEVVKSNKKPSQEVQVGQKLQIELPKVTAADDFGLVANQPAPATPPAEQSAGGVYSVNAVGFVNVTNEVRFNSATTDADGNGRLFSFGGQASKDTKPDLVAPGTFVMSSKGGFGGGGGERFASNLGPATRGFFDAEQANNETKLGLAFSGQTSFGRGDGLADGDPKSIGVLETPPVTTATAAGAVALDVLADQPQEEKNRFLGRYAAESQVKGKDVAGVEVDAKKPAAAAPNESRTEGVVTRGLSDGNTFARSSGGRNLSSVDDKLGETRSKQVDDLGRDRDQQVDSSGEKKFDSTILSLTHPPLAREGQSALQSRTLRNIDPRYATPSPVLRAPLALAKKPEAPQKVAEEKREAEKLAEVAERAPAEPGLAGGGMGGMGMGMNYYMSNPELMKRYFPQMYAMMQKAKESTNGQGLVGGPGLVTTGAVDPLTGLPADPNRVVTGQSIDPLTGLPMEGKPLNGRVEQLAREVETQQKLRNSVRERILQETVDKAIPRAGMVEMLDRAEANTGKAPSILEHFRGSERVARLEIAKEGADISPLMPNSQGASYDPYFLQTEQEKLKSQKVLNEVIEKLNLNNAWAESKGNGAALSTEQTRQLLGKMVTVRTPDKSSLVEIAVKSDKPDEAARIANTIAQVYKEQRDQQKAAASRRGVEELQKQLTELDEKVLKAKENLAKAQGEVKGEEVAAKPVSVAGVPQPEVATAVNAFSTFSLNVSDVSFKLAAASLEKGMMPEPATVRSEEFVNAFDYRDPAAAGSARVAFAWERARYPFAHDRDLLRFSVKTAASGREAGRPLNLVLLLDNSGSMERADRVRIIQECLRILTGQLQAQDKISVVTFARTARLQVDGLAGNAAGDLPARVGEFTPEGGTNLEEAMRVAYETAAKHFQTNGVNRVVLLTDGAANLGDVKPETLKEKVEAKRKEGIALDCFGIGWEGLNDDLLEQLSRNGDGRYGFVNSPEAASAEFAGQLAGALKVAASDVKVQVEFNPKRTTTYRQIGYAKHQLTKEQFRDNTVDAAEIGAAEAGNALYVAQVNPAGEGPIATVRARFKIPGTNDYREHEWVVPYEGASKGLEQSSPAMRLAGASSAFSEWLVASPYAGEVTPDRLLGLMGNVPETFANDGRPKQLEWMIRQAKSVAGK